MIDSSGRAVVCVAVDPFLLRSALYQYLLPDPRFTALLCPLGEDPTVFAPANHAHTVLASTHLNIPHTQVLTVTPPPAQDDRKASGGLTALLDLINLTAPTGATSRA